MKHCRWAGGWRGVVIVAWGASAVAPAAVAVAVGGAQGVAARHVAVDGCNAVLDQLAFALQDGETLDPSLPADGLHVVLATHVECRVAGDYTLRVEFEGGVATLTAAASAGESAPTELRPLAGAEQGVLEGVVRCARPGTLLLTLEFKRAGAMRARVQTSWSLANAGNASFASEPLPARVLSLPAALAPAARAARSIAEGRRLLTELGCANCHARERVEQAIAPRGLLDLTRVALRADADWLARWIAAPQRLAPGSAMPELLHGATASEDITAIGAWLRAVASASGDAEPGSGSEPAADAFLAAEGRRHYHELGCVACHGAFSSPAVAFADERQSSALPPLAAVAAPFGDCAGKWRISELTRFLLDPLAVRTHGTMPDFGLAPESARALAHYLVVQFGGAAPSTSPRGASGDAAAEAARIERGRTRFHELRCDRCHAVAGGAAPTTDAAALPLVALRAGRGCLASDPAGRGAAPRYELTPVEREQLAAGLASLAAVAAAGDAPAPLARTQARFTSLQCAACHERGGGGGPGALRDWFRSRSEADLGDEGRLPPRLDGVGARLRSPWLEQVVRDGARARPYLAAQMPRFGAATARELASGLAASEGRWRSDDPLASDDRGAADGSTDLERATIGRRLAGSGGMNCVTCHSFGDRPSAGTPGLDFLQFAQRLRRDWFVGYLLDPARQKPATRMPRYFEDGKSVVADVLEGDPVRQAAALWAWFERASAMPAPEGVPTGERRLLPVGDRPVVFRTFLARAGHRGIAIGHPSGLHFAFDADQVRLVEAWQGEFLDVAPVWEGRGGGIANQLGAPVWSAPAGPLLQLGEAASWPDRNGRATGAKFLGYRLEPDGTPVIEWELRPQSIPLDVPPDPDGIRVEERYLPDSRPDVLFVRKVRISRLQPEQRITLLPTGQRTRVLLQYSKVDAVVRDFTTEIAGPADTIPGDRAVVISAPAGSDTLELHLEVRR